MTDPETILAIFAEAHTLAPTSAQEYHMVRKGRLTIRRPQAPIEYWVERRAENKARKTCTCGQPVKPKILSQSKRALRHRAKAGVGVKSAYPTRCESCAQRRRKTQAHSTYT